MESPFPNSSEQIVASSLLLLSSSSSSEETTGKCDADRSESLMLSKSFSRSSASSSVSSDDVSSDEAYGRAIARFQRQIELKVVRKSRSKTLWISECRKLTSVEQKSIVVSGGSSSLTTEGSSGLSVGSSSLVSGSEICKPKVKRGRPFAKDSKKKPFYAYSSTHLLRRSEAILSVLTDNGCASEVRIRQLLGDNPDTSKALRMLLKKEKVKRSGAGGRIDPFIYQSLESSEWQRALRVLASEKAVY